MSKKVAVILSGCGVFDGTEVYEATLVQLRLDEADVVYQCMAPNINQARVLDHTTGEEMLETRNVLVEAARLCRGEIVDLAEADPAHYDAVIVPGGFGVAKNLSTFAFDGEGMTINDDFLKFIQGMNQQKKPIGLICIAPALAPKLFEGSTKCTLGKDDDGAAIALKNMGSEHQACNADEICIDDKHNLITTPAYMLPIRISEAAIGISKLIEEVLRRS